VLVLLHGLFGSAANWMGIARQLAPDWRVVVADLRNHGRSFHDPDVSYPALADDVQALLDALGLERAVLVGHSMGAKTAMWLALTAPERVERLVAVDSAPVGHASGVAGILRGLAAVDLSALSDRAAADAALADAVPHARVRDYLLQNLVRQDGRWHWRMNVPALLAGIDAITGWPEPPPDARYLGPTLFLHGGESGYVQPAHEPAIRALFPYARFRSVPGAGHWVYADRPAEFLAALRAFLA
jgi:pimeloyl-ACP methyl ester carboxylesterase